MGNTPVVHKAMVITVSDSGSRGERVDSSGPALEEMLVRAGFELAGGEIVPDNEKVIKDLLMNICDRGLIQLVVTTGGTGLAPSDRTPEATLAVIDRRVDGLAEVMRASGLSKTPHAALSRGVAGCRKATLIVNVPGSVKGSTESLEAILPALPHGLDKLTGDETPCGEGD